MPSRVCGIHLKQAVDEHIRNTKLRHALVEAEIPDKPCVVCGKAAGYEVYDD